MKQLHRKRGPTLAPEIPDTDSPPAGLSPEALAAIEAFLTRQELAQRWNCCGHTIARRRDLHPVRFGPRLVRYKLSDILAVERGAAA